MNDKVVINGESIYLDPARLTFNEATLSKYLQEEAAWYNYVGQNLADARKGLQECELRYESKFASKFSSYKEQGGSDKLAESNAKADVEVEALKQRVVDSKQAVESLNSYLRALDKSHENAINFGYMLRKEMDKLMVDIRRTSDGDLEKKIDDIIG
jgi:hypothetical protein